MSSFEDVAQLKVSSDQLVRTGDDFVDEFVCKICLINIVDCGPQLTKCSHLFCGDCLQQWFNAHPSNQTWAQRAKTGGAIPCPACKTPLRKETDVYPVEQHGNANSAFLWRMIQGLKIKCDGKHSMCGGRCSWTGEYGSYRKHLSSGTCGEGEFQVADTGAIETVKEDVYSLEESAKESQSTCSELSNELALEELHIESNADTSCSEELDCVESSDSPPPCYLELDQNYSSCLSHDFGSGDAEKLSSMQPPLEQLIHGPASIASSSPKKNKKSTKASKKSQGGNKEVLCDEPQVAQKQMTPEQLLAYQWQVAQYQQMAYAHRYSMALQAVRMQQMAQYYQQVQRVQ